MLGDGRLSLEREADQHYDLLAIDAFSGDSIPMHLVTREAMATYVRHLKPDGVIVFQATNRFVDIAPVVERLAAEFGMTAVLVSDAPESTEGADYWISGTDQIIVTKNARLLAAEPIQFGGAAAGGPSRLSRLDRRLLQSAEHPQVTDLMKFCAIQTRASNFACFGAVFPGYPQPLSTQNCELFFQCRLSPRGDT